jgi:hypothetical protein
VIKHQSAKKRKKKTMLMRRINVGIGFQLMLLNVLRGAIEESFDWKITGVVYRRINSIGTSTVFFVLCSSIIFYDYE